MTPARGVSIVFVTRNGIGTLPAVIDAIRRQDIDEPVEIVAVDSSSSDGTPELLRSRGVRVHSIPVADFDHGLTRNLGIELTTMDLVVLQVQDAVPAGPHWLRRLIEPLRADPSIAATFARQVPRADARALTKHYLSMWAAAGVREWTASIESADALSALAPIERLQRCAFDNVCSCVRRSVWAAVPFAGTSIAEDLQWSRDVLLAGHRIRYVPAAVVEHSHDRSARYELARTRLLHERLFELFELRTIPTAGQLAIAVGQSAVLHARCEWRSPARLPRALALAVAWPLGQYLGGRAAAAGRRSARRPGVV